MIVTRFTEMVGCALPIQQAGMGAAAPPELAAAVSEAGALGMLGTARPGLTAATLADLLEQVRLRTDKPFGVNFIVAPIFLHGTSTRPPLDVKCIEIAARAAKVVEFFYGEPEQRFVEMVHEGGALACWQIGTREEAIAAVRAGCDLVVAQGIEAGGHVRGTTSTMTLLDEVIAAVDVPVLAAGGIGTGRAMAAALAGADGVRVGTRFVAAAEAGVHPEYVAALIAAEPQDTAYTEAFSVGWSNAPHRVLRSSIAAAEVFEEGDAIGETTRLDGTRMPIIRFQPVVPDKTTMGAIGAMSLWAGESVGSVKRVQPAAEILRELVEEADQSNLQQERTAVRA